MKRVRKIVMALYAGFLLLPFALVLANFHGDSGPGPGSDNKLLNPLRSEFSTLDKFLTGLLDVLVQIAFPIIVLAVIYTGFLFVVARGNKDKLEEAKRAFLWTVIGGLVVLGAAALSKAIEGTVNQLRADSSPAIHLVLSDKQ